eukprot:326452-Pyramimonas_sp.AAC.1
MDSIKPRSLPGHPHQCPPVCGPRQGASQRRATRHEAPLPLRPACEGSSPICACTGGALADVEREVECFTPTLVAGR